MSKKFKSRKVPGKLKPGSKYMGSEDDLPVSKENNLISWWAKLSAISSSAANLVTGIPQGDTLPEYDQYNGGLGDATYRLKMSSRTYPGVIRVNRIPLWGLTGANSDGESDISYLNRAASEFYWTVNHANSRDRSYDKSDLFSCLIQLDNILQMITQCVRVYGIAKKFSATNKFIGKALVEACGFDYNIVEGNNLAQFLYRLNVCIHQLNKFYIPNIVDMFAEHMNDICRIYCDAPTINPQIVVVNNAGYYTFDDTTGSFTWVKESTASGITLRDMTYFDAIDAQISAMYNSQYMGIMNADMRKCFGPSAVVSIPEIPVDYTTELSYDREFNLKLRNAQFLATDEYVVKLGLHPVRVDELQATVYLTHVTARVGSAYDKVIYFNNDEPADVVNYLLATRFKFTFNARGAGESVTLKEAGSAILTTLDICNLDANHQPAWTYNIGPYVSLATNNEGEFLRTNRNLAYLLAYTDMLPVGSWRQFSVDNVTTMNVVRYNDIQNVGILEPDEYARINYAAMASLYEITNITGYKITSNGPSTI